jgi:hypothetical protein
VLGDIDARAAIDRPDNEFHRFRMEVVQPASTLRSTASLPLRVASSPFVAASQQTAATRRCMPWLQRSAPPAA